MDILEEIFGIYTTSLYHEGKRFVEVKTLSFLVGLMKGARKVVFFYYTSIVAFIIFTAGLFIITVEGLNLYQNVGTIYFDNIMIFASVLVILSSIFFFWSLSEKRWISAFGLSDYLQRNMKPPAKLPQKDTSSIKLDELQDLIDQAVKIRLNKIMSEYDNNIPTEANADLDKNYNGKDKTDNSLKI